MWSLLTHLCTYDEMIIIPGPILSVACQTSASPTGVRRYKPDGWDLTSALISCARIMLVILNILWPLGKCYCRLRCCYSSSLDDIHISYSAIWSALIVGNFTNIFMFIHDNLVNNIVCDSRREHDCYRATFAEVRTVIVFTSIHRHPTRFFQSERILRNLNFETLLSIRGACAYVGMLSSTRNGSVAGMSGTVIPMIFAASPNERPVSGSIVSTEKGTVQNRAGIDN